MAFRLHMAWVIFFADLRLFLVLFIGVGNKSKQGKCLAHLPCSN
jgi:hypothetical protein